MKIIVGSIVGNEKNKYLAEWLKNVSKFADIHCVVDDASTDGTGDMLEDFGCTVLHNSESMFKNNEPKLREKLWNLICEVAEEDDWIFIIDADEFYDFSKDVLHTEIQNAEDEEKKAIIIRLCDMWNETEYRVDGYWSPSFKRLFKFSFEPFGIEGSELHLSPVPAYIKDDNNVYVSSLKCRHRSYERDEDKDEKFNFYTKNSKGLFNLKHAYSIKKKPTLAKYDRHFLRKKILVTSLIHNRQWILPEFLKCLKNINYNEADINFMFIVNNNTDKGVDLLKKFCKDRKAIICEYNFKLHEDKEHKWDSNLITHMAIMRNMTLDYAKQLDVDYMINIDSDILFPSKLIRHLVSLDKDIVSPVFYAGWNSNSKLPQVWERGGYDISSSFIDVLKNSRALFKVGGLGAFTCISSRVWKKGVNYTRVYNLPSDMFGEDRDFCVRAVCAGFDLWASTYFDLLHVDNRAVLEGMKSTINIFK